VHSSPEDECCAAFHFLKDNYHAYRSKYALPVIEFQMTSNY